MEIGELIACILCIFLLCYVSVMYVKLGIKLQDHGRIIKYIVFPLWLVFADETGQGMLALSGALKGQTDAQARLGLHYLSGSMPSTYKRWWYQCNLWWPQNPERGHYWLDKAVATGDPQAETVLANAYLDGHMGLPRDTTQAVAYLKKIVENPKASKTVKADAAFSLYDLYSDQESTMYDQAAAMRYCLLAASENGEAAYKLAQAYETGDFGDVNLGKAYIYYKRAVEHGCGEAMGDYARLQQQLGQPVH